MKLRILSFLILLISPTVLYAYDDAINADRPGFSTGTHTVKPGKLNIEAGYEHAFNNKANNSTTDKVPLLNLRTGLTSKTELNILWNGWESQDKDNQPSKTSVTDLSVGGKTRLIQSEQYNITALGLISLPTGSAPSTSNNVDPTISLLWDSNLSEDISLFGMVQGASFKSGGDRIYTIEPVVGISFTHTENIGTYLEYYNKTYSRANFDTENIVDAGLTYLLNNELQLDVNLGLG